MAKIYEYCKFDSSTVLGCTYYFSSEKDFLEKDLVVEFKGGSKYIYHDVDGMSYKMFTTHESQGKAVHEILKGNFEYKKV
jgi:hypothetical protein